NGAALTPVPPVTPVAMGKSTRGVELKSLDDLDERQIAAWMIQVAALPGAGVQKAVAGRWMPLPSVLVGVPNQRMKLSCRSGHDWWNKLFLLVAAPARSLCAIR